MVLKPPPVPGSEFQVSIFTLEAAGDAQGYGKRLPDDLIQTSCIGRSVTEEKAVCPGTGFPVLVFSGQIYAPARVEQIVDSTGQDPAAAVCVLFKTLRVGQVRPKVPIGFGLEIRQVVLEAEKSIGSTSDQNI